jgi:hypothetical protein
LANAEADCERRKVLNHLRGKIVKKKAGEFGSPRFALRKF